MAGVVSGGHEFEVRLTAVLEACAAVAACITEAFGHHRLPGLAPRRTSRPVGRVSGWVVGSAPADEVASLRGA